MSALSKHYAGKECSGDQVDEIIQQATSHAIAQGWCELEASGKEMDVVLATSIAKPVGRLVQGWYETAARHCRNEEYYRNIVIEIGKMLGEEAYISDDGKRQQDVLCAKVVDLVRNRLTPAPSAQPAPSTPAQTAEGDLVERLRELADDIERNAAPSQIDEWLEIPLMRKAADELSRLRSAHADMVKALEPFAHRANAAECVDDGVIPNTTVVNCTLGECRVARRAISTVQGKP